MIPGIILFLDSLGGGELLLIFVVVLLFFGPKSIPEIAKGMGKATREFRNAMNDVRSEIETSMTVEDTKETPPKKEEGKTINDSEINSLDVSSGNNVSQRKVFGKEEEENKS